MHGMESARTRLSLKRLVIVLAGIVLALTLPGPRVAQAQGGATILVNSFNDDQKANDGICTLREAIISANKDKSGEKPDECAL